MLKMEHDFKKWPELPNSKLDEFYFKSPHKQILYNFFGIVNKVVDGDTIHVGTNFRDFDTVIRFLNTNAPEMNEGGQEAKDWLRGHIENKEVYIIVNRKNRVGKWGRILGLVYHAGQNMNELSITMGHATKFDERDVGEIPDPHKLEGLADVKY